MIRMVCGQCGKQLQVSDEYAGKQASCPGCRTEIIVPATGTPIGEYRDDPLSALAAAQAGAAAAPDYDPPPRRVLSYRHPPRHSDSNGMGIAGFVCSLVGLVACAGVLCPIGLILSAIGMQREPRGLAIAGLIIGIVGSVEVLVVILWWAALVALVVHPVSR